MQLKFLENKYLRILAISAVILMAMVFIQDYADFLDEHSDKVVKLGVNPQCNPTNSICSASIVNEGEFQRISLAIRDIVSAKREFTLKLAVKGFDFEGIQSITGHIEMPEENLTIPTIAFAADKTERLIVPEKWQAKVQLPSSPNGRHDWLIEIRLKSTKKEYRAEFPVSFLF